MEDGNLQCHYCGKTFRAPSMLKRHQERKTPCVPIIEAKATGKDIFCRHCGRKFASRPSMNRHVKQYCKIANTEDKLVDHTLRRQLEEQQRQITEQNTKIDRLTALLEQQQGLVPQGFAPSIQSIGPQDGPLAGTAKSGGERPPAQKEEPVGSRSAGEALYNPQDLRSFDKAEPLFRLTPKKIVTTKQEPRHLSPEAAAAALKSFRPAVPGEVDATYIRALAKVAQAEVDRLVVKLWDAAEDNLFNSEDEMTARAVATEYDLDPNAY
jgi:hypothetical protein